MEDHRLCYRKPITAAFCAVVFMSYLAVIGCGGEVACKPSSDANDPSCCPGEGACNAGSAFRCDREGHWRETAGCWAGTCLEGVCVLPDGGVEVTSGNDE